MISLLDDKRGEILRFLCTYPTETFSYADISRKTSVSKAWVSRKLTEFKAENIITVKKRGNTKFVTFNRDNPHTIHIKRLVNHVAFHETNIINQIISDLNHPDTVVLYGSFERGEDTEKSDVDIAIKTNQQYTVEENVLERPVNVFTYTEETLTDTMKESLANGSVLHGYLSL